MNNLDKYKALTTLTAQVSITRARTDPTKLILPSKIKMQGLIEKAKDATPIDDETLDQICWAIADAQHEGIVKALLELRQPSAQKEEDLSAFNEHMELLRPLYVLAFQVRMQEGLPHIDPADIITRLQEENILPHAGTETLAQKRATQMLLIRAQHEAMALEIERLKAGGVK